MNKKIQVFETNLSPFFWKRLKQALRQKQKELLNQFLFKTLTVSIQNLSLSLYEVFQTEFTILKNTGEIIENLAVFS